MDIVRSKLNTNKYLIPQQRTMQRCAPNRKRRLTDCSCFTKKQLLRIAEVWNNNVNVSTQTIQVTKQMKKCNIWKHIKKKINENSSCSNEQCWLGLSQLASASKSLRSMDIFKPLWPSEWFSKSNVFRNNSETETTWLSSDDIWNVLHQYEHSDQRKNGFSFLGVVPIDFSSHRFNGTCVANQYHIRSHAQLCNFSLETLPKNIHQFGIVFNTAKDGSSGEHWIALYCNIRMQKIIFFDSTGFPPPTQVNKFIETIASQMRKFRSTRDHDNKSKRRVKIIKNTKKHQTGNSECGIYVIHFIVNMLESVSWTKFNRKVIQDYKMIEQRKRYFNKY